MYKKIESPAVRLDGQASDRLNVKTRSGQYNEVLSPTSSAPHLVSDELHQASRSLVPERQLPSEARQMQAEGAADANTKDECAVVAEKVEAAVAVSVPQRKRTSPIVVAIKPGGRGNKDGRSTSPLSIRVVGAQDKLGSAADTLKTTQYSPRLGQGAPFVPYTPPAPGPRLGNGLGTALGNPYPGRIGLKGIIQNRYE